MQDRNHRVISYLRLSVTDRCNLRCIYCMPEEGLEFMPHGEILTYEEMLRLVRLCVRQGIRKVRLTGGEPLVRKGFIHFLKRLSRIKGLGEITLTTNGVLLKNFAADIRSCGICRINVSLDSLRPERFLRITGRDCYRQVWEGLDEAERVGFDPIKINVVAIKGVNDDEILDFANLALEKPYHIRFIELMPVGEQNAWRPERFLSIDEIYQEIQSVRDLIPIESGPDDGPAQRFRIKGGQGEIGLIGALSHHFCSVCNRLRLTPEGHLRGCLFSEQEMDLKTPLRQGKNDDHILRLIELAIKNKPKNHGLIEYGPRKCVRQMHSIGG
ncbi:MAG: GTP 3',8-cyclase MoaA [Deltaproteobacteria bacterium]|nr:MAG: GTP 3',8-cyclase MoaA [Deltaproteobacteria bacterium]